MPRNTRKSAVGRGAASNPANRFEAVRCEEDFQQLPAGELAHDRGKVATRYLPDDSQSIVSTNDSPDLGFRFSLNPYRGCAHGCSYCYARPSHEFLGMSAGLDFETRLLVKHDAPQLLRRWLDRRAWQCEQIVLSGVTDCYQPAEREYQLTRGCLRVALSCRQPISIVTKNALVTRDLDVLSELARHQLVHVTISVNSLDQSLTRRMEPRTSCPQARLDAIRELTEAGVPTGTLVAPVIPGLNDSEIPAVLRAVAEAGALAASMIMLRLPGVVKPIFLNWLEEHVPARKSVVESRIRHVRGGALNDASFGRRMSGEGVLAEQMHQTFQVFATKYGLRGKLPPLDVTGFRRPSDLSQRRLFD